MYWLLKTEPGSYSIDDLEKAPNRTTTWDGVRNYQARNFMRDKMQVGDHAFFYHSSCKQPGIVGIVQITRAAYVDPTAFDPDDHHYDPLSTPADPRWVMVDVSLVEKLSHLISLVDLRANKALASMLILRKGNRLSITPVTPEEWQGVLAMR